MLKRVIFIGICIGLLAPIESGAQQYRYMDESGNINFVDSIKEVPRRYRDQVIVPTPTPKLTKKQQMEYKRKLQALEREQAKKKREAELKAKKAAREAGASPSTDRTSSRPLRPTAADPQQPAPVLFFTSSSAMCVECGKVESLLLKLKVRYVRHDIVKSSSSYKLFDSMDLGTKVPVVKSADTVIKGYAPEAIIAAFKKKKGADGEDPRAESTTEEPAAAVPQAAATNNSASMPSEPTDESKLSLAPVKE